MNQDLITIGKRAQIAANKLALMNTATKNKALLQLADDLIKNKNQIIAANQQDLAAATQMPTKFTDRLMVNSQRIADMANGLRTIADLNDPTSQIDKGWITKDGLQILQRRVPLGVIGIIFEARPNVTVDATGLTFKSGNAVILRGGKEAIQTNTALVKILRESLQSQHLPVDAVQLITDTSHAIADEMMNLTDYIDVLIPRGGRALIQRVVTTRLVVLIVVTLLSANLCSILAFCSSLALASAALMSPSIPRIIAAIAGFCAVKYFSKAAGKVNLLVFFANCTVITSSSTSTTVPLPKDL